MEIGDRIKAMRKSIGMTQVQLSKITGISQSSISDIENRTNNPSSATLQLIASAFGCSIADLVDSNKEMPDIRIAGPREEVTRMLIELSPDDLQRVRDFVSGIKAARAK